VECKLVSHCGKQSRGFYKKLKSELPYDPAIPNQVYVKRKLK
jgi:hypothetical protein